MADTKTLLTVPADVPTLGSVTLEGVGIKGGLQLIDALNFSYAHVTTAVKMLGEVAVNRMENADELYSIVTSMSIAAAFVESVMNAIQRADECEELGRQRHD
jgi:hypothetical protein